MSNNNKDFVSMDEIDEQLSIIEEANTANPNLSKAVLVTADSPVEDILAKACIVLKPLAIILRGLVRICKWFKPKWVPYMQSAIDFEATVCEAAAKSKK